MSRLTAIIYSRRFYASLFLLVLLLSGCLTSPKHPREDSRLLVAQDISKHSKTFTSTLLTEDNKVYLVLKTTIFWNRYNYAEEEKIKFTKAKIELKNNKDKVIKIWNFQDVFFGKLFLSEDKKTVFIILIGRNSTKIYFLVKEGLVAISDFYSALGSPEPVVSQYARRAVA